MPSPDRSDPTDTLRRRDFGRRVLSCAAGLTLATRASRSPAQEPAPPAPPARVRIWCEATAPREVYPNDIDGALAEDLKARPGLNVATARLTDPDVGLSDADLDATDVLVWWGRLRHEDVPEARAAAVAERVKAGKLGFVALHASFASRPFAALMGAPCEPGAWREDGMPEHVTVKDPQHPLARDLAPFVIPRTSMFTEPFQVPEPEAVVLVSSWASGETFRSGMTWTIGQGRVAYFRPGDEKYPIFFHPAVRQVVANAVLWAARRA